MNLIFCFLCLFIVSCHNQADTTKIRINYSALSENDKFKYGMILYGENLSEGKTGVSIFSGTNIHPEDLIRRLDNDSNLSELKNGHWVFTGIGYHESKSIFCASKEITLVGGEEEIDLVFSPDNCTGTSSLLVSMQEFRENWSINGNLNTTNVILCPKTTYTNQCINYSSSYIYDCISNCISDSPSLSNYSLVISYYGNSVNEDFESDNNFSFDNSLSGKLDLSESSNNILTYGSVDSTLQVSLYLFLVSDGQFKFPSETITLKDSSLNSENLVHRIHSSNGLEGFRSPTFRPNIRVISGKIVADELEITDYDNCETAGIACDRNYLIYCVDCKN